MDVQKSTLAFLISTFFCLLTGISATSVMAAEAEAENEAADKLVVEEILVTARKREESLQDIPLSVTAFSAADIESAGLRNVEDVANLTPGFNVASLFGGDQATPVIRGLSTTIGEANVGFFVDGVYTGSRQIMTRLLGNFVERIEVAKGPQSALYGRNTFGGAVNYVTRQPSDELEGEVEATLGSDGRQAFLASIAGPMGGSGFYYRLAAMSDEFDGYYTNEKTGGDLDNRQTRGALGAITYKGDNLDIALNVVISEEDNGDSPMRFEENNDFFTSFAGLPPDYQMYTGEVPSHKDGFAMTQGGLDRDQLFSSLSINYDFGSTLFSSITGYNDFSHDRMIDSDYSDSDYHYTTSYNDVTELSQEFRLTSQDDGAVRWMVGVFAYSLEDDIESTAAYTGFLLPIFGGTHSQSSQETDSLAIFGSLDWDINDAWTLGVSARYGNEEKSVHVVDTPLPGGVPGIYNNKDDWNSFLPRVTLDWQFSDDHMAYASWAYSEKAGGFNIVTVTGGVLPEERTYDPESSNNFELGLKSTLADGRVQTSVAVYYIKWKDQIVRAIGGAGALLNDNAGETTSKGIEFELMAQLSENWDLRAGLSYNNSKYDEYYFAILGAIGMDPDLSGKDLQYTPDWTGNLSLGYTLPMSSGWDWFNRLDAIYTDEQTIVQTANAYVGSANRVNFRTGFGNENWTVTAWVYNLFEPNTASTGVFTGNPSRLPDLFIFGTRQGFPAFSPLVSSPDRRSYGITVKYRF